MAQERGRRVYRKATEEDRARHVEIREKIEAELPDIQRRVRERLALIRKDATPLRQALSVLRAERERQGLSLADINERTGIDRAALSRLENNEEANPTLATLERYADAAGKQLVVLLSDSKL